jgi:hypothetical protein
MNFHNNKACGVVFANLEIDIWWGKYFTGYTMNLFLFWEIGASLILIVFDEGTFLQGNRIYQSTRMHQRRAVAGWGLEKSNLQA